MKIRLNMKKTILKIIPTILLTSALPLQANAQTESYALEQVITLVRHGIRPQTDTEALNNATGQQWPTWSVPDGHLTQRGYQGMVNQAQYQTTDWQKQGLALYQNMPCDEQQKQVFLWAAPDERTQKTAEAFAQGINSNCHFNVKSTQYEHDPLFDALKMGVAVPYFDELHHQFKQRIADQTQLNTRYQSAITHLENAVCKTSSCEFLNKPWKLKLSKKGQPKLSGPAGEGANIGETIRLQYSENFPIQQVAFGHVKNADDVRELMRLHQAKYIYLNEILLYAQLGGSTLYQQMLNALTTTSTSDPLHRKLVVLVGHDTNISEIKTLLGFHWQLPQYLADDIPPGGSLTLSKYKEQNTGKMFIKIDFSARTLDQWRQLSPLTMQNPLPQATLNTPQCKTTAVGILCPLDTFLHDAQKRILPIAINQPLFQ